MKRIRIISVFLPIFLISCLFAFEKLEIKEISSQEERDYLPKKFPAELLDRLLKFVNVENSYTGKGSKMTEDILMRSFMFFYDCEKLKNYSVYDFEFSNKYDNPISLSVLFDKSSLKPYILFPGYDFDRLSLYFYEHSYDLFYLMDNSSHMASFICKLIEMFPMKYRHMHNSYFGEDVAYLFAKHSSLEKNPFKINNSRYTEKMIEATFMLPMFTLEMLPNKKRKWELQFVEYSIFGECVRYTFSGNVDNKNYLTFEDASYEVLFPEGTITFDEYVISHIVGK